MVLDKASGSSSSSSAKCFVGKVRSMKGLLGCKRKSSVDVTLQEELLLHAGACLEFRRTCQRLEFRLTCQRLGFRRTYQQQTYQAVKQVIWHLSLVRVQQLHIELAIWLALQPEAVVLMQHHVGVGMVYGVSKGHGAAALVLVHVKEFAGEGVLHETLEGLHHLGYQLVQCEQYGHLHELAVYLLGGLIILYSHLPTASLDVIGASIGWLAALLAALVCLAQPAERMPKQLEIQPMKLRMVTAAAVLLMQKSMPGKCSIPPLIKALMEAEEDIVAVMAIEDTPSLCTIA
ncbi:MAG: hypothetical protein FRX49_05935 [Trebouxia sp. A1-2]|nr:MAG: hypothetical protein FRX49_05935 [Trebouxia sp. A1-2]